MVGQVVGDIVTRSGSPNNDHLFSNIFLRSGIFEGMGDLTLKFFLQPIKNQCRMNRLGGWITCLGDFGIVDDPPPSPVAKTRWVGRKTRLISVPSGSIRVRLTIHVPEVSFSADVTVEEVQTFSSMILG